MYDRASENLCKLNKLKGHQIFASRNLQTHFIKEKNMKRILFSAILSATLIFIAGSFIEANAQTFSGSFGKNSVKRGTTVMGSITMSLPSGLHTNSANPKGEYMIPTRVKLSASGVKLGAVQYPQGKNRKFSFSDEVINVYEGRTTFKFNMTVPSNYRGSSVKVVATVSYQACTDEVCYPPKEKQVILRARIVR